MEWKEVLLSEFLEFNPKRTIKKNEVARKITMDLLIPHSKQIYSFKYEPYTGGAKFSNGDTIMARITPCLENGKHAYVSCLNEGEIAYGSTEYIVLCGKNGVSDNEFVYYLSHTPQFVNTAIKSMVGSSGRQRAQVPVLENLIMSVPVNLSDQRKIAGILSALDAKIENNNKINANLEAQAQALFKSWFVDFTPFKDQPFVDSELGPIPQGWKVGKLGDLGDIICGKTPSKKNKNFYGGNIPFIKIPDMHGHVFVNESADSLTNTGSLSQKNKLIPSHSLMVSCIATVGLVSINSKPAHTNQQINSIIPICDYLLYFLYLFIKRNKDYLQNLGRGGTTTLNVNTKTFSSILIAIPQKDVVINFHQIVSPIFKTIENNIQENQRLAALRDTLLPKLMSGEIKL